jgi:hypothetical protein
MAFGAVFMLKLGACCMAPDAHFGGRRINRRNSIKVFRAAEKTYYAVRFRDLKVRSAQLFFMTVARNYNMAGQFSASV